MRFRFEDFSEELQQATLAAFGQLARVSVLNNSDEAQAAVSYPSPSAGSNYIKTLSLMRGSPHLIRDYLISREPLDFTLGQQAQEILSDQAKFILEPVWERHQVELWAWEAENLQWPK